MSTSFDLRAKTLGETFSFYVSGLNPQKIRACADQADAVVVSGVGGPTTVRRLREAGWEGTAIFDGAAYTNRESRVDDFKWFDEQESAGADRLLTQGIWVGSESNQAQFMSQIESEVNLAMMRGATCLLAIDRRWLTQTKQLEEMLQCLQSLTVPVALVLGDPSDPIGYAGAVDGLVAVSKSVTDLSVIRCDQAGIGALAFGVAHASFGLTTGHRHVVPPGIRSFAKQNDRSARIFVRDLLDWFTASRINEWSTVNVSLHCYDSCCSGDRIERFLDDRLRPEADLHNRTVLAGLAEEILSAPVEDGVRRREFGRICHEAVSRYGPMGGWWTEIKPKRQLTQWAVYC